MKILFLSYENGHRGHDNPYETLADVNIKGLNFLIKKRLKLAESKTWNRFSGGVARVVLEELGAEYEILEEINSWETGENRPKLHHKPDITYELTSGNY